MDDFTNILNNMKDTKDILIINNCLEQIDRSLNNIEIKLYIEKTEFTGFKYIKSFGNSKFSNERLLLFCSDNKLNKIILNGKFIIYYDINIGNKYCEGYFKDGKLDGQFIKYDKVGNIVLKNNYVNGLKSGYCVLMRNGTQIICNYKNGKLHGSYRKWKDNLLLEYYIYNNGEKVINNSSDISNINKYFK